MERGFAAVALSGEHSQNERNHALQALRDGRARVCVATDVAARGIDVASLSLVIHVEVPRDAETLQHRSGRTGRAGRKGTAVIIVPFPRRRRVEEMLRRARIAAEAIDVPSAAAIRERDRERLLATLLEPVEASDEDRLLADALMEKLAPQDIALALAQAHRKAMPEPEELIDLSAGAREQGRDTAHHRAGFEDTVWFRMDIGRRQNADPRWILPVLCRRGHITRNEIGAIRIAANETFFQVPRAIEAKFRAALQRTATDGAEDESGIHIELSPETPRDAARGNAAGKRRAHFGGSNAANPQPYREHGPRRGGQRDGGQRESGARDFERRESGRGKDGPRGDTPRGDRPRGDGPRHDGPRKFDRTKARKGPPRK